LGEGPYGYTDGDFDVTVKKRDVVIDAGAWIGDFSAYAASKGAITYAFEPANDTFQWLCKTRELNNVNGGGKFILSKEDWAVVSVKLICQLIIRTVKEIR
jgi:tRNA G37 N-methylase Trm5